MNATLDNDDYDFCSEDRFLQMFELTFDLSVMSIFAPWCVGACCCVVPDKGIASFETMDTLVEQNISVALMVPSVLSYVKRYLDDIHLPVLRLSLFCGEALPHDLVTTWSKSVPNATIENVYGPTEATIFCTRYRWNEADSESQSANGIVPIGTPMIGVQVDILKDNGSFCEAGEKGELCLAGDQVISAYWDNEDATSNAFHEIDTPEGTVRLYRTGDIVYLDDHGDLIYCGRSDSQVKIDGHRIELGEIEHYARQQAGHALAAVLVTDDIISGGSSLTLFVQDADFTKQSLAAFLEKALPDYMQPREIIIIDKMPLNQNGKIDRKALARMKD
jgi:non-ribosomal peptide synthetase component F